MTLSVLTSVIVIVGYRREIQQSSALTWHQVYEYTFSIGISTIELQPAPSASTDANARLEKINVKKLPSL